MAKLKLFFFLFILVIPISLAGSPLGFELQSTINYTPNISPYCGDGSCNNGETCSTCSQDCGQCSSGGGGGSSGGSSSTYVPPIEEQNITEEIYIPPSKEEITTIEDNDSEEAPLNESEETTITEPEEEPVSEEKEFKIPDFLKQVFAGFMLFFVILWVWKITIPYMKKLADKKYEAPIIFHNGKSLLENFKEINQNLRYTDKTLKESLKEFDRWKKS